jgi:enoyl-CoA hydratase
MATTTLAASPAIAVSPTPALTLANVLYEKQDAIAYVTVNRPKVLNALNTPTWKDLRTAFEDARDDAKVRGVILTGAGNKAFIAGADISELAKITAFEAEQSSRFGQEVLDLIENLGKPVIAAINGFALGGGCETAISAQEACLIGLVNELVPASDLITRAEAILKKIAANAPIAVKFAIEAANKGGETSQSEGLLLEASFFGLCAATDDKKEGTTAFLEKRVPRFNGR